MDDRTKLSVWEKAPKIRGKEPTLYRKDINGHEMYWPSFNKKTEMGWLCKNNSRKTKNFSLDDFDAVAYFYQDEKPDKDDDKKQSGDKDKKEKKSSGDKAPKEKSKTK